MEGIFRPARLTKSNITKEEGKAITSLKKEKNIIIISADKGQMTVVMDMDRYEKYMEAMLKDNSTYQILKKESTEENNIKITAQYLTGKQKITLDANNNLIHTVSIIP